MILDKVRGNSRKDFQYSEIDFKYGNFRASTRTQYFMANR